MINRVLFFLRSDSWLSRSIYLFIIIIACVITLWHKLDDILILDSAFFSLIVRSFEHADLSTWYRLFTLPNGHDMQYRPLGFMGYYFFMGEFFNHNILSYKILSVLTFSITSYLIFRIIFIWSRSVLLSFLLIIFISFSEFI